MGVINGDKFVISGIEMLTTGMNVFKYPNWNVSIICLSIFFFYHFFFVNFCSFFRVKHFHRHNRINVTLFHCWQNSFFLLLRSFPQQKTQYHFPMWLWWLLYVWIIFKGEWIYGEVKQTLKCWKTFEEIFEDFP